MSKCGHAMNETQEAQREQERIFKRMLQAVPACLCGTLDHPATLSDLRFAAQHEIDMFEEDQDGHLTASEIRLVRKFIGKIERYL
jgi:hypothetical protein